MRSTCVNVLQDVLEEWLMIHELDYDYEFYSRHKWCEWLNNQHDLLEDAELVLLIQNQLQDFLHTEDVWEELEDLAKGVGYQLLEGHRWGCWLGFFPVDDWRPIPQGNYEDILKDER